MQQWTPSDVVVGVCAGMCFVLGLIVAPVAAGSVWIPVLIGLALIAMLTWARRQRSPRRQDASKR